MRPPGVILAQISDQFVVRPFTKANPSGDRLFVTVTMRFRCTDQAVACGVSKVG
jgi:hypothetical protein